MAKTKVLIAVKTYPTLASKYDELVCTAGFREDGTWVRIYPIPFRKLDYDKQYKKYDWVEIDLVRNKSDFRPESFRPYSIDESISIVGHLNTDNNWLLRKKIVLKNVYTNLDILIADAKDKNKYTSLAVFKPTSIHDFIFEPIEREWDKSKLDKLKAKALQLNLFKNAENPFEVVKKLPYKFSFVFSDDSGKRSTLMIEDWETGQLYWNCLKKHEGNEQKACADVRQKYFDDFSKTKDLYFYLGTTREFHLIAPNPFIIIGTFHPKKDAQLSLFNI
ncbi:MAG TPA: hypothetical protein PKG96_10270 [Bacilli bacterium]|jgi:hypothetical protein|nr:hypothetical protein [Bacilli bacterium]HPH00459.1 hypothetical protein [Tenuifilaceae bacterium]HPN22963.1 hypothetical protein [Tenuifilaceae bacterium]HPV56961.1 hypothetical protein [Tenuifilaceae bacterium]HQM05382.1 hypothetical protein [Tenuifilaceae bacterium]